MKFTVPPSIQCVVWDWNGTIFDDAWICQEITNQQLEELGLQPLSSETHQMLFKHPVREYYFDMGVSFSDEEFERRSVVFHQQYEQQRSRGKVREEAVALCKRFQEQGVQQVLLSAHPEQELRELVELCGLTPFFDAVLGLPNYNAASKVERGVSWLEEHSLSGEQVLVIGDTNHDFAVAEALSASVLLIPSGYQHKNLLLQTGAPVSDSLAEVVVFEELTEEATSSS